MITGNEAMGEILKDKDMNLTEINRLIYGATTVITEEVNDAEYYTCETRSPKTPPCVRRKRESINGIRKEVSALTEVKIEEKEKKTQNMKRKRLLRKYNIQKKENLGLGIEQLKQKVPGKTLRLSRHRKTQNHCYHNKNV